MKKLSKREKVLIYIMILMLIGAGGFALIRYVGMEQYIAASDELDDAKMQQALQQGNIDSKDSVLTTMKELSDFQEAHLTTFFPAMTGDELNKEISKYMKRNHLTLEGFSLTSAQDAKDETQGTSQEASQDANQGEETSSNTDGISNESFTATKISLQMTGSYSNFIAFIQEAATDVRIRVTAFQVYDENDKVVYRSSNQTSYTYYVDALYYTVK